MTKKKIQIDLSIRLISADSKAITLQPAHVLSPKAAKNRSILEIKKNETDPCMLVFDFSTRAGHRENSKCPKKVNFDERTA